MDCPGALRSTSDWFSSCCCVAYVDGAWRYFDATSDRGMSGFGFCCFHVTAEALTGHEWDASFVARLTEQTVPEA